MSEKIVFLILAAAIGLSSFIPSASEMQAYFEQGQKLFVIEDYPNAIKEFEKILSVKSPFLNTNNVMITLGDEFILPVPVAATYQLGNSYKNLAEYDRAVACFKKVEQKSSIRKLRAMAQYQVVICRYNQENYSETITESKILVEKYAQSKYVERGYYNIGWAAFRLKEYEQAIDYFTRQQELFPKGDYAPRAQYQVGECYVKTADYQQAIAAYRALVKNYLPRDFSRRQWTDVELDRLKKRSQIESGVGKGRKEEHLIELSAKAFIKTGDAWLELDQPDSAIAAYRKITEDYRPLTDLVETAYIKIGEVELKRSGLEASRAVYLDAIDNSEDRVFQGKMQYQIATVSFENKAYQQAIEEFELYAEGYAEVAEAVGFTPDEARYQIATAYYESQNFSEALLNYQTVIDSFKTSRLVPASFYGSGLCRQRLEKFEEALETFRGFIDAYPQNEQVPNAFLQIARIYYDKKEYSQSIESYLQVLEQPGDSAQIDINTIYFELGICYRDAENYDEAIVALQKIDKVSPFFPGAYSEISEIFLGQNEYGKAVETLTQVLDLVSAADTKAQIHYYLARVYVTADDYDNALEHFTIALAALTNPQLRASSLFGRGAIYFEKNQYRKAIIDFEALFKEDADRNTTNKARRRLATCYLKTGQVTKALSMAESFAADAKTEIDKGDALLTLAQIQYELGRYNNGIGTANEIVLLNVEAALKAQAHFLMGNCYLGLSDYQHAIGIYTNGLNNYPDSQYYPDFLYQLGIAYYNSGNFERASEEFKRLVASYPRSENALFARYYRAYSLYRLGDWVAAAQVFGKIADQYPSKNIAAECRYQQAESIFNSQNFEKALLLYRKVRQDYPTSEFAARALYNSAWCLVKQNQTDEAMNTFSMIITTYPDSVYAADAQFTIGDYHYNNKRYVEAAAAYRKVADNFPEHELAEKAREHTHELAQITSFLEYEKASTLFDHKEYREAIEAFKVIIKKYPDADVVIGSRCNIAASYEQLGDMENALMIYEEIMEFYKDSPEHADAYAFAKEHRDWIKENY